MQTVFSATPGIQLLMTLPGVGFILAVVIALEVGNAICMHRRHRPRRHVSRLYERVARRKGHSKAIGAVARHLAEAAYWILTKQEPYREPNAAAVSSTGDKRG